MNSRHYVIVATALMLAAPALAQVPTPERTLQNAPTAAAQYSDSAATDTSSPAIPDTAINRPGSALDIGTKLSLHAQILAQINGSYAMPPQAEVVARLHH